MEDKDWLLGEIFAIHHKLPHLCLEEITEAAVLVRLGRRKTILRQGEICHAFYFNRNGMMRIVNEWEGEEDTVAIGEGGDVFTSLHSWWKEEPSIFSLVSVVPTDIWIISYDDMRRMLDKWPDLWQWMCKLLTEQFYGFERRYMFFGRCSAEERYRNFMARRSGTFLHLSVKHMAQYLKIAPETLSRIRARVVRGDRKKTK